MSGATVCLRCGDFPSGENLLAEKIALCRECFEFRSVNDGLFALAPPAPVRRRRVVLILGGVLAGFLVGAVIGRVFLQGLFPIPKTARVSVATMAMLIGGGIGAVSGEILVILATILLRVFHDDRTLWKTHLMERLGFAGVDPARFQHVTLKISGKRAERGLLLEDEGGLALLGNRGSRIVIPYGEITFTKAVKPRLLPWLVYAAVRPRGGGMLVLRSCEALTIPAERAATEALAERIAARVSRAS